MRTDHHSQSVHLVMARPFSVSRHLSIYINGIKPHYAFPQFESCLTAPTLQNSGQDDVTLIFEWYGDN